MFQPRKADPAVTARKAPVRFHISVNAEMMASVGSSGSGIRSHKLAAGGQQAATRLPGRPDTCPAPRLLQYRSTIKPDSRSELCGELVAGRATDRFLRLTQSTW